MPDELPDESLYVLLLFQGSAYTTNITQVDCSEHLTAQSKMFKSSCSATMSTSCHLQTTL